MNEGTMDVQPKRSTAVIKCEKHGLHYDSSKMDGCVICRREAGGGTAAAPMAKEAASGSLGQALIMTLILLVLTTAGLFMTHQLVAQKIKAWLPAGGDATALDGGFEGSMDEVGLPADAAEPVEPYSGPED